MTISETDLKIMRAERLTDFSDGGGKMSGAQVIDGEVNAVFDDISPLDRTVGRVSLRKLFVDVHTNSTDKYLGAHAIITDPPSDPHVNVVMFTTRSWVDERDDARERVESYTVPGPETDWMLFGEHVIGQKMIRVFSVQNAKSGTESSSAETPSIGDSLLLAQSIIGTDVTGQYIRVQKIESRRIQTFSVADGAIFHKDVLIFEITKPLEMRFLGATTVARTGNTSPTAIRLTSYADAAQYFGVKKILSQLSIGDMSIALDSPNASLVPSAYIETPIVDIPAGIGRTQYVPAGPTWVMDITGSATAVETDGIWSVKIYFPRGVLPGSLIATINGSEFIDDLEGNLVVNGVSTGSIGGAVDYATGSVILSKNAAWSATGSVSAKPAVAIVSSTNSARINISLNNRSFSYVYSLGPIPAALTVSVDFLALGKWYRLTDDGAGRLVSTSSSGVGTIDYATGGVIVTFTVMPDVGSSVIFSWAPSVSYTSRGGVLVPPKLVISQTLDDHPIAPGSVEITWPGGLASCSTNGVITGSATGNISFHTGEIRLFPNVIPQTGTEFSFSWDKNLKNTQVFTVTADQHNVVTLTLPGGPIKPGSISLFFNVLVPADDAEYIDGELSEWVPPETSRSINVIDNGSGGLYFYSGGDLSPIFGSTVNYSTGVVTFNTEINVAVKRLQTKPKEVFIPSAYHGSAGTFYTRPPVYIAVSLPSRFLPGTIINANFILATTSATPSSATLLLPAIILDLSTQTHDEIIAGSVAFTFAGVRYIDRDGSIYRSQNVLTNAATYAGTIDYQTGLVTLTNWVAGSNTLTLESMVTTPGISFITSIVFRTPTAPISIGQMQVTAVSRSGQVISTVASTDGSLVSGRTAGAVDWTTGVVDLAFGKRVLNSLLPEALKSAAWYDPDDIGEDGKIWVPELIKSGTVRFNAVGISSLAIDASILGVETVRLPQDGKVPIFRVGNVAVIHNTQRLELANPVVAGSTYSCGRTLLSYAKLYDADGLIVPTLLYSVDLDAGTVTFADPLNLVGYAQPLTIEHRIEDTSLITDVQITGQLQLMKPVRHVYPTTGTYISSALVIGDMQAHVTHVFDQQTWSGIYNDTVIGPAAGASYNDTIYPIRVVNASAVQERWALVFTNTTAFNCYGEFSGLVAQGSTGANFAPINPVTGLPYFTIDYRGWGAGWSAGAVQRFDTVAANYPIWLARTTLQSDPVDYTDNFKLQIRGATN